MHMLFVVISAAMQLNQPENFSGRWGGGGDDS